jgi:formylmethanofuran dehydrogenase subunit E
MTDFLICGIKFEEFLIRVEEFHGYRSPGILLGGLMIDSALQELEPTPYLNVISETVVCLPDAIQLLTPCTLGNGFMQVLDWGKFAITAYDRQTLIGVRTFLDSVRMPEYPLINDWFERTGQPREKPPFEGLAEEILTAGPNLILNRSVLLHRPLKDSNPMPTGNCKKCGESYTVYHGQACPACSGDAYYTYYEPSENPENL